MKRLAGSIAALLLFSGPAIADDSLTIYGNYYKETSTRVYEPIVHLEKDLPEDFDLDATVGVDQITSASGAFTPEDKVISEFREELDVRLHKQMGIFRPGVSGRISYEPDYTSARGGLDLEVSLDRDISTARVFGQFQRDWVRERNGMVNDHLYTSLIGASFTQVLTKDLIGGIGVDARVLRGYQESVYRPEHHPRKRNRYSMNAWARYFLEATETSLIPRYCFYGDNWDLQAHTFDLEVSQVLSGAFELVLRFQYYTQNEVYFAHTRDPYNTMDPKLFSFYRMEYSFGLRIPLSVFLGTAFETLAGSFIEPIYTFYDPHTRNPADPQIYGVGHIAQLGWYWPF